MAYATTTYLAIAAITASLAGAGATVYSQQQQAKTQENAADYNARLAENEARNTELEAAESARRQRVAKRKEVARVRNELSATGTLTTTGTPLSILGETSSNMDTSIADAFRASNMQAASFRSQGAMGLWEASQARTAANIASAGAVIQGIGSAASSGYTSYNQGAFTRTKRTT